MEFSRVGGESGRSVLGDPAISVAVLWEEKGKFNRSSFPKKKTEGRRKCGGGPVRTAGGKGLDRYDRPQ